MCSIGHHDHVDTIRPPVKHLDNTWRQLLRTMPRQTLAKNKSDLTAKLRAEIDADKAEEIAEQHGYVSPQMELLPVAGAGDDYMFTPQAEPQGWWNRDDR